MEDEKFAISEFEQRRLIVDLLIRITVENSIMRDYVKVILGKDNPKVFEEMSKKFAARYKELNLRLKENIYANYGHLDLDDVLPSL
jgi:hypothetical protein